MARTSRKSIASTSITKQFDTAIYARLSLVDNGKNKGDSIKTQIDLLIQYIKDNPELQLVRIYCDNGYSGTNFKRPEWNALLADIKMRKINCILVKDLSRIGRDYIETGNYLECLFPSMGVRILAINDYYDSCSTNYGKDSLRIALKNVVNNYYAKDISKKIATTTYIKQRKGDYQGAHPPYGYIYSKEGTHKLVIDKETEGVVVQIFEWSMKGFTDNQIVHMLNNKGVSTPRRHYYELGILHSNKYAENKLWYHSSVSRILENPVYTGCMVRGKSKESFYNNIKRYDRIESEWIVVPDKHDAIISKEDFEEVNALRKERSKQ